jgi:diguanylate cyclase (GGDEF)-like protein/PAS domain S-box-containing protein
MNTAELLPWLLTLLASGLAATAFFLWRKTLSRLRIAGYPTDTQSIANQSLVLENCDDVVWLYDIESQQLLYVTPSIEKQRGWKATELIGKPLAELYPAAEVEKTHALTEGLRDSQARTGTSVPSVRKELSVPLKSGGTLPIETSFKLINNDNGQSLALGISRDITERLQVEQQLREAEERVRLALYCSGDSVWDIDLQTRAMTFAEGWESVIGYNGAELEHTFDAYSRLIHADDLSKLQAELERHVNGETPSMQIEFRVKAKDGGWRWVLSRGKIWSYSADGKARRVIGTHTDITSRKVAEVAMSRTNIKLHTQIDEIRVLQTKLAEQAVRDPMTGLYNRRYLDETLEREVARARREGNPLSVVMLDVDNFKKLNDSYGHQAGDEVLKALAEMLREDTRMEDVACRYGGEEFLVLLPSMPLDKARDRAESWRSKLEQHTFVFGNFPLTATASFGVSGYPNHGKTPDELTRAADTALYSAKHNGRNRVEMFEEAPIVFVTGNSTGSPSNTA